MIRCNSITFVPSRELVFNCEKTAHHLVCLFFFFFLLCLVFLILYESESSLVDVSGLTEEWSEVLYRTHVYAPSNQRFWEQWVLGYGHVLRGRWRAHWGVHAGEPPKKFRRGNRRGKCLEFVSLLSVNSSDWNAGFLPKQQHEWLPHNGVFVSIIVQLVFCFAFITLPSSTLKPKIWISEDLWRICLFLGHRLFNCLWCFLLFFLPLLLICQFPKK